MIKRWNSIVFLNKSACYLENDDEGESSAHDVPVPVAVLIAVTLLVVPVAGETTILKQRQY